MDAKLDELVREAFQARGLSGLRPLAEFLEERYRAREPSRLLSRLRDLERAAHDPQRMEAAWTTAIATALSDTEVPWERLWVDRLQGGALNIGEAERLVVKGTPAATFLLSRCEDLHVSVGSDFDTDRLARLEAILPMPIPLHVGLTDASATHLDAVLALSTLRSLNLRQRSGPVDILDVSRLAATHAAPRIESLSVTGQVSEPWLSALFTEARFDQLERLYCDIPEESFSSLPLIGALAIPLVEWTVQSPSSSAIEAIAASPCLASLRSLSLCDLMIYGDDSRRIQRLLADSVHLSRVRVATSTL